MLKELFYCLLEILKRNRDNSTSKFDAFLGISVLQGMNILTIYGILNYFLNINMPKEIAAFAGIFLYIIITIVNYFYLFRKEKEIVIIFKKQTNQRQNKGRLYFWIYVITSIALFIIVLTTMVTPNY